MDVTRHYLAPSIEDAYRVWHQHPNNALLSGGLWLKKIGTPIETLIDLGNLGLNQIVTTEQEIIIGALTPLRDVEKHPDIIAIGQGYISQAIGSIMGVGLRNLATIGGSIAGKYPFSDVITALLTLDVTLSFYPDHTMTLTDFLDQRGKLETILTHIHIKKSDVVGHFKKIGNTPLDFAIINLAIAYRKNDIRISIGSRPAVAKLAIKTAEYLNDLTTIEPPHIEEAARRMLDELNFASTMAASGDYRRTLASAYLKRGLKEVLGHDR
jgi:CO/xanthine dehydrogenase FAD-binding subunit